MASGPIYEKIPSSSTRLIVPQKTVMTGHEIKAQSLTTSSSQGDFQISSSKWGVGWKTPFVMIAFYVFAMLIAFAHLGLFLYLDGKRADGKDRAAPQSYVSTASNIFAGTFSLGVKSSLAVAFAQYLWYRLRISTMKVSTIESLFGIRSNPLLLFDRSVITNGFIPVLITILIWSVSLAATFPPGALTVTATTKNSLQTTNVPTFNASFFGNSSGFDAQRFSFEGFLCNNNETIFTAGFKPYVSNLAAHVLTSGMPTNMASPCGANCSFTLLLDMPCMECNTTVSSAVPPEIDTSPGVCESDATLEYPTFVADWNEASGIFNVSTYLTVPPYQTTNLLCSSARATYTLNINYTNNLLEIQPFFTSITPLNFTMPTLPGSELIPADELSNSLYFPGFMKYLETSDSNYSFEYGLHALNWTPSLVSWYRDQQLLAIISGMAISLEGTLTESGIQVQGASEESTIIANTRFYPTYGIYPLEIPPTLYNHSNFEIWQGQITETTQLEQENEIRSDINVTEGSLNEALFNITLSLITDFGWWNTTGTIVTKTESINAYTFSKPLNLILPYFLTLVLAIPMLAMGAFALHKNGVSAVDGGFLQVLVTSTGSPKLEKLAAGGCLGGSESVPQNLKDLEIRFGEFVGGGSIENGDIRRAGFGTEDEIVPLTKGMLYGTK